MQQPEFLNRCGHCVACINCCPQHAIQWKHATQKRVRCQNPGVSVSDIIDGMGNAEYSTKNNSFPITLRDCAESKFSI